MQRWICPRCDREFVRPNTSHVCIPGCSVEETFADRPEQRPIYEAVAAYVRSLGPVHEDAVRVGVFLKVRAKLAELRPKSRWLSLELVLPRQADSARFSRVLRMTSDKYVHVIRLASVDDVDDEVRNWLTEAYHAADQQPG